jgi:hypothetical protein
MAKVNVPVTKSKGFVEIETDNLPDEVYKEALLQGLKVLVNRGMSKITKADIPDEATFKAEAQAKAEKNVEDIYAGKVRITGGKAKKASGVVMTEARRLAKNLVKDAMKSAGIKISHVEASEITKAANALLDEDPSIIEQAKANVEAREKQVEGEGDKLASIVGSISISQKKVAAAEAKRAKGGTLSAKQAGKTAKHKPAQEANA